MLCATVLACAGGLVVALRGCGAQWVPLGMLIGIIVGAAVLALTSLLWGGRLDAWPLVIGAWVGVEFNCADSVPLASQGV